MFASYDTRLVRIRKENRVDSARVAESENDKRISIFKSC